jgi:2-methylisocitrate lyase-like PEP mutase family enzyme
MLCGLGSGNLNARIAESIKRAKAFQDSGADGIFVPFVHEIETVAELKKEIKLPLNILIEATLDVAELKKPKSGTYKHRIRPKFNYPQPVKKAK